MSLSVYYHQCVTLLEDLDLDADHAVNPLAVFARIVGDPERTATTYYTMYNAYILCKVY